MGPTVALHTQVTKPFRKILRLGTLRRANKISPCLTLGLLTRKKWTAMLWGHSVGTATLAAKNNYRAWLLVRMQTSSTPSDKRLPRDPEKLKSKAKRLKSRAKIWIATRKECLLNSNLKRSKIGLRLKETRTRITRMKVRWMVRKLRDRLKEESPSQFRLPLKTNAAGAALSPVTHTRTKSPSSRNNPENTLAWTRAKLRTLQPQRDCLRNSAKSNPLSSLKLSTTKEFILKNKGCRSFKITKTRWTMEIRSNLSILPPVAIPVDSKHRSFTKRTTPRSYTRKAKILTDRHLRNISNTTIRS